MLYATLMLLTLAGLWASWRGHGAAVPLLLVVIAWTVMAFALDITMPLTISL
ncbi:hypothetical protein ACQW02_06170 [Humitalea sp. 24SJ18S-53]|uniref:hypothetical protein n=1 Tax=Humitalea sp. 24SJ18S-53 TaxID=3422307 RepID=UPI003D67B434